MSEKIITDAVATEETDRVFIHFDAPNLNAPMHVTIGGGVQPFQMWGCAQFLLRLGNKFADAADMQHAEIARMQSKIIRRDA